MKQIYTSVIIIAGFLFSTAAWGQNDTQAKKDSLWKVIATVKEKDKLDAYKQLATIYFYEAQESSLIRDTLLALHKDMKQEAEQQKNFEYAGFSLANTVLMYDNCKMHDEILKVIPEHLDYYVKHDLWDYYYDAHRTLVKIYIFKGEYQKALDEATKVYNDAKKRENEYGIAVALFAISTTYGEMVRPEEAAKYMRESIEVFKKLGKWSRLINCYFYLCQDLSNLERYDDLQKEFKDYEKAIRLYEETRSVKTEGVWCNLWGLQARTYLKLGDYEKAEFYCKKMENTNALYIRATVLNIRANLYEERKEYSKALEQIELCLKLEEDHASSAWLRVLEKARIISKMGRIDEGYEIYLNVINAKDSIRNTEFNAQLDDLRTQYEVDKYIAEKERNRNYFLFALAGVALLLILVTVVFINRQKIRRKNKTLVLQIKELQELQKIKENELLQKTTFQMPETDITGLCPESRRDKLCLKLRDLLLKDKIYRDENLSRDSLTERLGINRYDLEDAFKFCFNSPYSEYINELRLKDAVVMLEQSDLPIAEISEKVGFGTQRTFHRQFTAQYNMPPKDYRALARKE